MPPHHRFDRHEGLDRHSLSPRVEDEPSHSELLDAVLDIRDRLVKVEDELRRLK